MAAVRGRSALTFSLRRASLTGRETAAEGVGGVVVDIAAAGGFWSYSAARSRRNWGRLSIYCSVGSYAAVCGINWAPVRWKA